MGQSVSLGCILTGQYVLAYVSIIHLFILKSDTWWIRICHISIYDMYLILDTLPDPLIRAT
uniref:Uncharacterized protein n=1 Tax=Setaria italica TaxID=4555 RepID=K3YFI7_SETIT